VEKPTELAFRQTPFLGPPTLDALLEDQPAVACVFDMLQSVPVGLRRQIGE
jgi:hypothetical protein